MPKVNYIEANGQQHAVELKTGVSVMEGAVWNNIPGIDAECGGACACATCHVYVDGAWLAKLPARDGVEDSMLSLAENVRAESRLSCQLKVTDALDGLVVRLPASQR